MNAADDRDMKVRMKKVVTTTRKIRIEVEGHDLIRLLETTGQIPKVSARNGVKVFVTVPGGGDWSGSDLDIERETRIQIEWEEVETKEEAGS